MGTSCRCYASVFASLAVSLALVACGASEPTPAEKNAELLKNEQAASVQQAALEDEVMLAFRNKVGLYTETGVENSFKSSSGPCNVESVFGAEGPRDTDGAKLYDPKGRGGVVISLFEGTRKGDCIAIALEALGWQQDPPTSE